MLGLSQSRLVTEEDLLDLHGKVAIVTGANTGIGYATVQFLARRGAKVYIASRDEGRVTAAIEKLKAENIEDGTVHFLKLELSNPRNGRLAAEEFLKKETRLDILVNNAARTADGPSQLDKDGLLDMMVTNHITHFAFTEALLPVLTKTAQEPDTDVRIVNVSSMAHSRISPRTFDKAALNKNYGGSVGESLDTYGNSKLANILHMKELQRRFDAENVPILCLALHPGAVNTIGSTAFMSTMPILGTFSRYLTSAFFGETRYGAMTPAFAAASKEIHDNREKYKGAYLVPVAKLAKPSESAQNPQLAKELYEVTETVLKELK